MGHDHHDLGEKAKIPDYKIYRVEDAPELLKIQNVLAAKGLKDPWLRQGFCIRNEVWRFKESEWGTHRGRLTTFFFRGFKYGFAAFVATITIEKAIEVFGKKKAEGHH